jgi:uncharacterized protein YqeY
MIREKLKEQMILAMKAKDSATLSAIRMVISKIKEKEINSRDNNIVELSENEIILLMQGMLKQRLDSINEYLKGNRKDLADKEMLEVNIIKQFMPTQLSEAEISNVVDEAISSVAPKDIKEIGKVIAYVKEHYALVVDMSLVSKITKEKLS